VTVRYSRTAEHELREQLAYLAKHSPQAARHLAAAVKALLADLDDGAFEGPEVQLRTGRAAHTWPLPPLRIFYERRGAELYIVRVRHQKRRPITK
jgi:plasmid stabilization system protein ParE